MVIDKAIGRDVMDHKRIENLEKKITVLEEEVKELKQLLTNQYGSKTEFTVQAKKPSNHEEAVSHQPMKPTEVYEQQVKKSTNWEEQLFQIWLPRIFIFVFIIGVLWGFKAASDYGVMSEGVKVTLGYIVSAAFVGVGHLQIVKKRSVLGQVLLGGSVPILMLTTFAAHSLYGMIGPSFAFMLNALWVVAGLGMTVYYRSQALGIISIIGGVLVPFLIESNSPNQLVFISYETLLYLAFAFIAWRLNYHVLYGLAAILLNVVLLVYGWFVEFTSLLGAALLIQHVCLLLLSAVRKGNEFIYASTTLASLFIVYGWISSTMEKTTVTIIIAVLIVVYVLCIKVYKKEKVKFDFFMSYLVIGIAFLINQLLNKEDALLLYIIQGAVTCYLAHKYNNPIQKFVGYAIYTISAVAVMAIPIEAVFSQPTLNWLGFLGTMLFLVFIQNNSMKKSTLFVASTSILFTILTLSFVTQEVQLFTEALSTNTQTLALTFSWILLAIIGLSIGIVKSFKAGTYIGISLLFLTLIKLVLYDLPFIPLAIRAVLFIALGGIGLIVSRILHKKMI